MLAKIKDFIRINAKALAAFAASAVAMLWVHLSGHTLDPELEKTIEALLIGIIVWAIPNK